MPPAEQIANGCKVADPSLTVKQSEATQRVNEFQQAARDAGGYKFYSGSFTQITLLREMVKAAASLNDNQYCAAAEAMGNLSKLFVADRPAEFDSAVFAAAITPKPVETTAGTRPGSVVANSPATKVTENQERLVADARRLRGYVDEDNKGAIPLAFAEGHSKFDSELAYAINEVGSGKIFLEKAMRSSPGRAVDYQTGLENLTEALRYVVAKINSPVFTEDSKQMRGMIDNRTDSYKLNNDYSYRASALEKIAGTIGEIRDRVAEVAR